MNRLKSISSRAVQSGPYIVYVDGVEYSRHNTERVAGASATIALINNPRSEIVYKRDYTVVVEGVFEETDDTGFEITDKTLTTEVSK
jgi:hypothetical protein